MDFKNKNLGLLLTRSVDRLEKESNPERELRPYIELAKVFKKIFIFSYVPKRSNKNVLPHNIEIIYRPMLIPATLYMFLMPFIHAKTFRQIDILKTNQMDGAWAGVIAKKLFKKKLIVRCGYEWLNYLRTNGALFYKKLLARAVENWSYKNADKIFITSKEDKDFIVKEFKIKDENIEIVRNYIDTEKFKPNNSISKDPRRIIFVGRFHKDKNLSMLVESLRGLDCRLVLIGAGREEAEIRKVAQNFSVNIEILGKISQEDLPIELQKSSIFVLPSKSEGNPKALLEAMAVGLPCVGTNVKGIREVIDEGVCGLLCGLSSESLFETIKSLLENKDLRDRLGSNARKKIEQDYSLESIIAKELNIYDKYI